MQEVNDPPVLGYIQENIMFDDKGHLHLIDLGLAETGITQSCSGSTSECGTLQYMAPELIKMKI